MKRRAALLLLLSSASLQGQQPALARGAGNWHGSFDLRNRFVSGIGGVSDVYRSVVNLGEGPRLFDADLRYDPAGAAWADSLTMTANSWGGDPYNTASLQASKRELYEFRLDYRNIAYFNNLPTFANPLLGEGAALSQRALDITRRNLDLDFRFKPRSRISPYFSYSRAEGFGRGVTPFVAGGNEFPVSTAFDDRMNAIRAGVVVDLGRASLTLEQGRIGFRDEQQVFFRDAGLQRGNRRVPLLGREILLDELEQAYDARGRGVTSRVALQARPWQRLQFAGQFLYTQPKIDVSHVADSSGSFLLLSTLAPFAGQVESSLAAASRPNPSGSWTTEFRPVDRLRIVQTFHTDRFHVSSASALRATFDPAAAAAAEELVNRLLVVNYNQHQVDVIVDVSRHASLRGGHRVTWGDSQVPAASLQLGDTPRTRGELRRQAALGGAAVRLQNGRLRLNFDLEAARSENVFFRTSLVDYERGRASARYRLSSSLDLRGSFAILSNRNPSQEIDFDFQSRQTSVSIAWTPGGGRRFSLLTDYTRSEIRSDILMVQLPFFGLGNARYRDNGHHAGAFAELALAGAARLTLGGVMSVNTGSRPTDYFQPRAGIAAPLREGLSVVGEWRWYGFAETFLAVESFRAHTFSTGLQWDF